MDMIEINKKYAMDCLEDALESDFKLKSYLLGVGLVAVKVRAAGSGEEVMSIPLTMDCIYEYHKLHPEAHLDERVSELMIDNLTNIIDYKFFLTSLNEVKYMMDAQKKKEATFDVDIDLLLRTARNSLDTYKDLFIHEDLEDLENKYDYIQSKK